MSMLDPLSEYRWVAEAVIVAALLGLAGYERLKVADARLDASACDTNLAKEKAGRADDRTAAANARTAAAAAAASASEDARAREHVLQYRATNAENRYATLQPQHDAALAANRALLADNGRLRNDIATYAAGPAGRGLAPDTVAAASRRAGILGGLLAEALRADAESAHDAESNGDAVRALLSAWPSDARPASDD